MGTLLKYEDIYEEIDEDNEINVIVDDGCELSPSKDLKSVKANGFNIRNIKQTPELCLAAVRQNSHAIRYIEDPTEEVCLEAVSQNGKALVYVKNQTPKNCLTAVKDFGPALEHVKVQTLEICRAAVKQTSLAFKYVDSKFITDIKATMLQVHW